MDTPIDVRKLAPKTDNRWAAHFRATLALGIPLIGAQLAQLGINTTDVMIVGRLGAENLAAMVLSAQFLFTILVFGSGFAIAVIPMVAQAYGKGDVVSVRAVTAHGSLGRAGLLGDHAAGVLQLRAYPAGRRPEARSGGTGAWLHPDRAVRRAARPALQRHARARQCDRQSGGRSQRDDRDAGAQCLLRLCAGARAARFPGNGAGGSRDRFGRRAGCGLPFIVAYVQSREETRRYEIFVRFWRPDWKAFWEVVRLGLPISITILAEVSLFTVASLLMGQIGTIELAVHGIAPQWASGIAFKIPPGLSAKATSSAGGARGGDYTAYHPVLSSSSCVIAMAGGILFAIARRPYSQFLDTTLPEAPQVLLEALGRDTGPKTSSRWRPRRHQPISRCAA